NCPTAPIVLACNARPTCDQAKLIAGAATDSGAGRETVDCTSAGPVISGCNGSHIFTVTATDACNNNGTCTVTYTWREDHVGPTFANCPTAPIVLACNARPTCYQAKLAAGAATDGCGGAVTVGCTTAGPLL